MKKPQVKKKLPKTFYCPLCREEGTVRVDTKRSREDLVVLVCSNCSGSFKDVRKKLDEPVDVYYRFLDYCRRNKEGIYAHIDRGSKPMRSKTGGATVENQEAKQDSTALDCPFDDGSDEEEEEGEGKGAEEGHNSPLDADGDE